MRDFDSINLGDTIYSDIGENRYLHELYDNILYNHSLRLFVSDAPNRPLCVDDALRFSDILSKSTDPQNADLHKIWAQEMVALLKAGDSQDPSINFYLGAVLSSAENYRGLTMITPDHYSGTVLERIYTEFSKDYLSIPAEPEMQFFRTQKEVYDRLGDPYFSYSGPTSMGKSFVMRMFMKTRIMQGVTDNYILLVPTKALINEVSSKIINDLKSLLAEYDYRIITSAGALSLKQDHNFILVLTPERLLYLMLSNPDIRIDYLFIDEAHKISSKDSRSTYYYKVVDMISRRAIKPHIIFASPNIPNPEIYLKLISGVATGEEHRLITTFSPVSQVKYLIDMPAKQVQMFNAYNGTYAEIEGVHVPPSFCELITRIGDGMQNIIYCSSTARAIALALEFAKHKNSSDNKDLLTISKDIKNEVHGDYYLAELITKGVAYHIGYLPSAIRIRIEELYRQGLIRTIFCTSTLVEGVNLPADNLFVTNYKNGRTKMTAVDFKNLVGRVGRIEYNLYGNVFLVRLEDTLKIDDFKELLTQDVPPQKLSLASELTKIQKMKIIESLVLGNIQLLKHPKNQSNDNYTLMRKFALILLRDITKGHRSLVWQEFSSFLDEDKESKIKAAFDKAENKPDDDINISVDQTNNLTDAIAKKLAYPTLNEHGNVDYNTLITFLEKLCEVFKWEAYERSTLGHLGKNGKHGKLRWYAVILSQWVKGTGLSYIMDQAIQYKLKHPESSVKINGNFENYDDSLLHRNHVIADTLQVIENIILFSISNYFLRFSSEYKRFHKVDSFKNDWYEYVEYGTTNPLSIMLQRNGFSRETSTYIRTNRNEYVVKMQNGDLKLRRSLLKCGSVSVRKEAEDIQYNIPELFNEES